MTTIPNSTLIYISACNSKPCSLQHFNVSKHFAQLLSRRQNTHFLVASYQNRNETCSNSIDTNENWTFEVKDFNQLELLTSVHCWNHLNRTRLTHSIKNKRVLLLNCIAAYRLYGLTWLISEFQWTAATAVTNFQTGYIKWNRSFARFPFHCIWLFFFVCNFRRENSGFHYKIEMCINIHDWRILSEKLRRRDGMKAQLGRTITAVFVGIWWK